MFSRIYVLTALSGFISLLNICCVPTIEIDNEGDYTVSGAINKGIGFAISCSYFNFLFSM